MSADFVTTFGETKAYCCEAQMYVDLIGMPSTALKVCDKCAGVLVGPLAPVSMDDNISAPLLEEYKRWLP